MHSKNLRYFFTVLLLLSAGIQCTAYASVEAATRNPEVIDIKYPALITSCQVSKSDKYFLDAPILLLVFSVSSDSSVLYEYVNGKSTFLAAMHYGEGGFDAEGGVWSAHLAYDVYNYLITRPFTFVNPKEKSNLSKLLQHPKQCSIKYTSLEGYEKS